MLEHVNIGGLIYTVKRDDGTAKKLNGEGNWGYIDYCNMEIQVNNISVSQRQQAALCHEIIHGLLHQAGLQQFNTEDVVTPLGAQLFQLLKYNDFSFLYCGTQEPAPNLTPDDITADVKQPAQTDAEKAEALEQALTDTIRDLIIIRDDVFKVTENQVSNSLSALIIKLNKLLKEVR